VRVCALALLVCSAAGCAAHRSPDAVSLFVHRSKTEYKDGATFDAPDATKASGDAGSARVQAALLSDPSVPKSPRPKTSDSPTLESTNPSLVALLAAVRAHPSADGYLAVADAYQRLGVLDEAETNFQNAAKLDNRSSAAQEGLARVWRDWGWPQFALPNAYRAVSFAPKSASAENTLGTVFFALGDPENAEKHFQKAFSLDPKAAYALNNLCYVSFMLGDGGPAISRCTDALALAPDATTTRNNLALVYAAEGKTDAAAAEFAKVSDAPNTAFNIGITHMARQEYDAAIEPLEAACRAKPEVQGACAWAKEARKLAKKL
jgi:tetratricopeptide (TPR) repeat protein